MNYHNITTDDMLNGEGLRVVLWVSGCTVHCPRCQNAQTWDFSSGIPFTDETMSEILQSLNKPYISGLTISGGNPTEWRNIHTVLKIVKTIKSEYHEKSIWIYSGDIWEEMYGNVIYKELFKYIDVLVDGKYIDDLRDVNLPYKGSSNQRVIDVKKSNEQGQIVLWCE